MDSLSEKVFEFLSKILASLRSGPKSLYIPIGLAVAGLVFLSIGLMQLSNAHTDSPSQSDTSLEKQATDSGKATNLFTMQVDVEGAVVHPGVYNLQQNARVQDALIAAGGLSSTADREVIAKVLNLAAKVADGAKLYVPILGDTSVIPAQAGIQGSTGTVLGAQAGLININTASESQLDSLPGIGSVTAKKIIAARPFSSIDDLLAKKVVSKSVFEKIKDLITIY